MANLVVLQIVDKHFLACPTKHTEESGFLAVPLKKSLAKEYTKASAGKKCKFDSSCFYVKLSPCPFRISFRRSHSEQHP